MFVIASFPCTLNSYFLLVVLLVTLVSSKFSECLWSSQIQLYIFLLDLVYLVFLKSSLRETCFENVGGCHLQNCLKNIQTFCRWQPCTFLFLEALVKDYNTKNKNSDNRNDTNRKKISWIPNIGPKIKKEFKKVNKDITFTSDKSLKHPMSKQTKTTT